MRKRLWSPDEDEKLQKYVSQHGFGNWSEVAKKTGLQRCGKSCRLRWINYLRPDLKRGKFSPEEKLIIVNLQKVFGNSWSKIAAHLPGRTDSDIKNFWHSHFRKKRPQQLLTSAALHGILPSFTLQNPISHAPSSLLSSISPNSLSSSPFAPFPSSSSYLHHHPLFSPPSDSLSRTLHSSISPNPNTSLMNANSICFIPPNPNISIAKNPSSALASAAISAHAAAPFSSSATIPNLINVTHNGLCSKQENNYMQLANPHISSILQQPAIEEGVAEAMDMYTGKEEEDQDHQNQEGIIGNDFELMGSLCHHAATWYNGNKVRDRVTASATEHESRNMDMKVVESNMLGNSCTSSMSTKGRESTLQMLMYDSSPPNDMVHAGAPPPPPPEGLDLVVWSCVNRPSQLDQEELLPPHIALASSNMHNISLNLHEHTHDFLELES